MIVKLFLLLKSWQKMFESSVNSYDSQTQGSEQLLPVQFESSVNSYDSQTKI